MSILKRKKQEGIDSTTTCICQEEGISTLIKCDNKSCYNPWWHYECAGLTGITPAAARKLTWTCPCCTINRFQNNYERDDITSIDTEKLREEIKVGIDECLPRIVNEVVKQVQHGSDMIKQNLTKSFAEIMKEQKAESQYIPISKTVIKEAIYEEKKEQEKINERRRNVMVFNAKEAESDNSDEAKTEDLMLVQKVCNSVHEGILEANNEIVSIKRFGKKNSDKIRPMMITFKTEKAKRMLFGNLHKLQNYNDLKSVSFNHDMTENEKKTTKTKLDEAKKKTEELKNNLTLSDDAKNWVYKIRGPPWDQKMVKVRPRQQI